MATKNPKPQYPRLADKVICFMQDSLLQNLAWLDYSFGRAQRLTKLDMNGNQVFYPACYLDNGEYKDVRPDQNVGNISFFLVEDPTEIDWNRNQQKKFTVPFSIIIWYNIEKAYGYGSNTEYVKADILKKLSLIKLPNQGESFTITKIWDKAENIYKGFSIKEVNSQFLMFPFSGLRFEGELNYTESCS